MELSALMDKVKKFFLQPWLRSAIFLVLAAMALLILIEIMIVKNLIPAVIGDTAIWFVLVVSFILLALYPWQRFHRQYDRLFLESFVTGIIVGSVSAVAKFIFNPELWTALNLLAEPVRVGFVAVVVVWIVLKFARNRPSTIVVA